MAHRGLRDNAPPDKTTDKGMAKSAGNEGYQPSGRSKISSRVAPFGEKPLRRERASSASASHRGNGTEPDHLRAFDQNAEKQTPGHRIAFEETPMFAEKVVDDDATQDCGIPLGQDLRETQVECEEEEEGSEDETQHPIAGVRLNESLGPTQPFRAPATPPRDFEPCVSNNELMRAIQNMTGQFGNCLNQLGKVTTDVKGLEVSLATTIDTKMEDFKTAMDVKMESRFTHFKTDHLDPFQEEMKRKLEQFDMDIKMLKQSSTASETSLREAASLVVKSAASTASASNGRKHSPEFIQVKGWMDWSSADSQEKSKFSKAEVMKVLGKVFGEISKWELSHLIDEKKTADMMGSKVMFTQVWIWFSKDCNEDDKWFLLRKLRKAAEESEFHFTGCDYGLRFALQQDQTGMQLNQATGKFYNWLRKQGVNNSDKIKSEYKKDGVSFYYVETPDGRGKLLSRFDKSRCDWELQEGNLSEVVRKRVVAEQVMRDLLSN